MKQINVCLPLHEHMQTHLTTAICCHTPGVSAAIYTPQPTPIRASIAAAPASETGNAFRRGSKSHSHICFSLYAENNE